MVIGYFLSFKSSNYILKYRKCKDIWRISFQITFAKVLNFGKGKKREVITIFKIAHLA
jgi:hypothetical protein